MIDLASNEIMCRNPKTKRKPTQKRRADDPRKVHTHPPVALHLRWQGASRKKKRKDATVPHANKACLRVTCSVERSGPWSGDCVPIVHSGTASLTTAAHCNALPSVGIARRFILKFAELPELLAQQSTLGNGGLEGRVFRLRIETWRQRAHLSQGACAHLL